MISYLGYLNKLVDKYNNTYHCSIGKRPTDADFSALTKGIELSHNTPIFTVDDRVRITKYKKATPKIGQV